MTEAQSWPVSGWIARPTALRMPEAKIRSFLPSGSKARMSARRVSLLSSLTFDREPTETNRVLPSFENSRSRVQWPPPPTRSSPLGMFLTIISAWPVALVSPFW